MGRNIGTECERLLSFLAGGVDVAAMLANLGKASVGHRGGGIGLQGRLELALGFEGKAAVHKLLTLFDQG